MAGEDLGVPGVPSTGGAVEGGLGSAIGSGLEGGIPTTGFEGMAANLGPDVAAAGLAANLEPKLDVAPDVGIQELAHTNVDVAIPTTETVVPPTPEAAIPVPPEEGTAAAEAAAAPATPPEGGGNPPERPAVETAEPSAEPPTAAEAAAAETAAEPATAPEAADKTARKRGLERKLNERTATPAERRELRDLNRNPEQLRADLEQKVKDGTATDQDLEKLDELDSSEAASKLTPEQQAEKLSQDIDKLGEELMSKFANGQEVTANDLERLRNLRAQESLINQGFSPEQAKAAMREAVTGKGEKQSRAMNEIKGKIQELMALEIQLLSVPKTVDALRKQREPVKQAARTKHDQAESASTPEKRLQLKGEEYNLYMQIANINAAIVRQKYMVPILEAKRTDLEQYVRRKVGVTSGLTALMEWGGAKTKNVATQVRIGVEEETDYRFGNY